MNFQLAHTAVPIVLSDGASLELERVLSINAEIGTSRVVMQMGYFISHLLKGLQDLSNERGIIVNNAEDWNKLNFTIDYVGIVLFEVVYDRRTLERQFVVDSFHWFYRLYHLCKDLID